MEGVSQHQKLSVERFSATLHELTHIQCLKEKK